MTLDEAIKHAEEVAEENEKNAKSINNIYKKSCLECAKEHRQLAEWLKELKDYRERIPSYEAGYNDAKREIALSDEYARAYTRGFEKVMEYCTNKLDELNKQKEIKGGKR